uniref:Putative HIRAN domain containing protein n=1 Tax=viral metagenome TaxID=1070528 RepID=A0A6M3L989_9ZZZZ
MNENKSYEFYVAGVQFHQAKTVLGELEEGFLLELKPDPTNKFDPNAIEIVYYGPEEPTMLGFVPKKFSAEVSAFMEIHENVVCVLTKLTPAAKPWEQLKVKIGVAEETELEDENA